MLKGTQKLLAACLCRRRTSLIHACQVLIQLVKLCRRPGSSLVLQCLDGSSEPALLLVCILGWACSRFIAC